MSMKNVAISRWICHGEAHRAREEVVRQCIDDYDADAGCADMLADFHEAHFEEGLREEPPEPSIHIENPTSVHDRGFSTTDEMAQKRQTLPS